MSRAGVLFALNPVEAYTKYRRAAVFGSGRGYAAIHRSAWKKNSVNFAFTEFYEVRYPQATPK
jgi:hypothetical protein